MLLHVICVLVTFMRCIGAASQEHSEFNPMDDGFAPSINTSNAITQNLIVKFHNYFRSSVNPPASNMLAMKWHKNAAADAQRWAEKCKLLKFENERGRNVPDLKECGQNVYIATEQVSWTAAISYWSSHQNFFQYDSMQNEPDEVSAYTQLVWATSHKVGCGVARCPNVYTHNPTDVLYYYVCNYCPVGNSQVERPYKKGAQCGHCPNSCDSIGLCTNPCPYVNQLSNCEWIYNQDTKFCSGLTPFTIEWTYCMATCNCYDTGEIYERMM